MMKNWHYVLLSAVGFSGAHAGCDFGTGQETETAPAALESGFDRVDPLPHDPPPIEMCDPTTDYWDIETTQQCVTCEDLLLLAKDNCADSGKEVVLYECYDPWGVCTPTGLFTEIEFICACSPFLGRAYSH